MRWMRGLMLFLAGAAFGIFTMQPSAAPQDKSVGLRLNHFGLYVKDLDESTNFFTKTMGFRPAFSLKDKEGKPSLVYLQIDHDTFLELAPASVDRPVGCLARRIVVRRSEQDGHRTAGTQRKSR